MRHPMMITATGALLAWLCASQAAAQIDPEPANHVVIVIDGSGSYRARQAEAVERSTALLDKIAQTKLHRGDPDTDRVTLISLDAIPEVLWHGTLRDLKKIDHAAWAKRFRARTDYAQCTDVSAAFQLATQYLTGDPRWVSQYLFVFSDLIHEPPTTTITKCQVPKRPSLPPADFPWSLLQHVSVAVFWVPPDQKLAWRRVVSEHGLSATFALYTDAESGAVTITPPPRPTLPDLTDGARQTAQARYLGYVTAAGTGFGIILGLIVLVPVAGTCVAMARRRLRSQGTRLTRAATGGPRHPGPARLRPPSVPRPPQGSHAPRSLPFSNSPRA